MFAKHALHLFFYYSQKVSTGGEKLHIHIFFTCIHSQNKQTKKKENSKKENYPTYIYVLLI